MEEKGTEKERKSEWVEENSCKGGRRENGGGNGAEMQKASVSGQDCQQKKTPPTNIVAQSGWDSSTEQTTQGGLRGSRLILLGVPSILVLSHSKLTQRVSHSLSFSPSLSFAPFLSPPVTHCFFLTFVFSFFSHFLASCMSVTFRGRKSFKLNNVWSMFQLCTSKCDPSTGSIWTCFLLHASWM